LLYLIGGAAPSGKSTLARRLPDAQGAPCFCLDYLTSGLEEGAPGLGVRHELTNRRRAELVWPIVRGLLRNVVDVERGYVAEGDVLLVAEFAAAREGRVRACSLGCSDGAAVDKRASIRAFPSAVNDWVAGLSDRDLGELVAEMHFDGSGSVTDALRRAEEYLVGGGQ